MTIFSNKKLNFFDELNAILESIIQQKRLAYFFIFLCVFITVFIFPSTNIVSIMEARNCITAREIAASNNWLLPTLNGELRIEKPPLPTWITAVFGLVFGFNDIGILRLPAALITLFAAFAVYELANLFSHNRKIALTSALIFSTSYLIIYMGRQASWDIYAFGFMMMGIYFLSLGWKTRKWTHFLFAGIMIGFSIMSKGPAAMYALLFPFLIAYFSVNSFGILKKSWWQLSVLIIATVVVGFSWFLYVNSITPEAATASFSKEASNWFHYQVKPFHYYKDFPVHSGMWFILLIGSIFLPLIKQKLEYRKIYIFMLIWMLSSVILLSIVPEKKTRYLLPVFFPYTIVIAVFLYNFWQKLHKNLFVKIIYNIHLLLLVILALVLPILSYIYLLQSGKISLWWWVVSSIFFWGNGILLFMGFRQRKKLFQFICMIDFMLLLVFFMLKPANELIVKNPDYKQINIANLNKFKVLDYYCIDEIIRPEIIWAAQHIIKPIDKLDINDIANAPAVIFSTKKLSETFLFKSEKNFTFEIIGSVDYNFVHKDSRRYQQGLAKYIYVLSHLHGEK